MVLGGLKKPNLNSLLRDTMVSGSLITELHEMMSVSKLRHKKGRKIAKKITS